MKRNKKPYRRVRKAVGTGAIGIAGSDMNSCTHSEASALQSAKDSLKC